MTVLLKPVDSVLSSVAAPMCCCCVALRAKFYTKI